MENQVNIPKLRFPEFYGEWEIKNLGQISDLITKGTTPNKFVNEGIKFIKIECFDSDKINPEKCLFIEEKTHNKELKRSILQENDLLFAIAGATIGKVNIVAKEILPANTNQALSIIRLSPKENLRYIFQILKSNRMQKYIKDSISVGAQPNLNLEQINNFSFFYPSLLEQEKIASFLTAVDDKLQALKKKKALLEQYKKGVMQKIFSQELRFKPARSAGGADDGSEFPEWEVKKLGEVCEIVGGGTPETNVSEYWQGKIQWFTPTEIKSDYVSKSIRTITEIGLKKSSAKLLPKGTILLTTRATIGEAAIALEECSTNQGFQSLIVKGNMNNIYVFNWIKQNKFELTKRANGSTFPEISKTEIEQIEIQVPTLPEQTKIAKFLSAIDEKINLVNGQIEKMEVWKKGLLQKMFV